MSGLSSIESHNYQYKIWVLNHESNVPYGQIYNYLLLQSYHNALIICGSIIDYKKLSAISKECKDSRIHKSPINYDPYKKMWDELGGQGLWKLTEQLHREVNNRILNFGLKLKVEFTQKLANEFMDEILSKSKTDSFKGKVKEYLVSAQTRNRAQVYSLYPRRYKTLWEKYWREDDTGRDNLDSVVLYRGRLIDIQDSYVNFQMKQKKLRKEG